MTVIPIEMQLKPFILLILIVCFGSLNIIYSKTTENIGNKREVRAFKGMLVSFMIYSLVDLRLLMGDSFYTAFPRPIVKFIISLGFGAMSFSCYFWFLHVDANLHRPAWARKIKAFNVWAVIIQIPLIVCLILLFTPLNYFVYELTDTVAVFKPMVGMLLLMDYVYLIAATVLSIGNWRKARTKPDKKKYSSQVIFILFFTLSGFLIGFLLNLPAIELCVLPVVIKLFVELQDSQIYTDALTKLFNRRRMTEFINEEIATCNEENPLTIIMIDLDFFKSINDILGHDEGDKALISFSHALRKALLSHNAVAARWGGDEFVVAGKDPAIADDFRNLLTSSLETCNTLQYMPRFSVGAYTCTSPSMTCEQALVEADEVLYKDKEIQHRDADSFKAILLGIKG